MAKLYFIRHAMTDANQSGSMVKNYDDTHILPFDVEDWKKRIGKHINYNKMTDLIMTSPAARCVETANCIFGNESEIFYNANLKEFDCEGLGDLKFWEIDEKTFDEKTGLTNADMDLQIDVLIDAFKEAEKICNCKKIICFSHGMVIRYIYHYFNNNKKISPYDVINSKGFTFANLDMLEVDTETGKTEVYRFKEPVNHKAN